MTPFIILQPQVCSIDILGSFIISNHKWVQCAHPSSSQSKSSLIWIAIGEPPIRHCWSTHVKTWSLGCFLIAERLIASDFYYQWIDIAELLIVSPMYFFYSPHFSKLYYWFVAIRNLLLFFSVPVVGHGFESNNFYALNPFRVCSY